MSMRTITALLMLSVLAGCSQTRTYQVSVANHTGSPITFGLVKQGDPYERNWASPEVAAVRGDQPNPAMWAAIPPGKTATSDAVRGRFRKDASAVLRVYEGSLNLPEILATSRGQPNRCDVSLHPGLNRFEVVEEEGQLVARREDPEPRSPVQRQ